MKNSYEEQWIMKPQDYRRKRELLLNVYKEVAVSYTHLDVYKSQLYSQNMWKGEKSCVARDDRKRGSCWFSIIAFYDLNVMRLKNPRIIYLIGIF